MVAKLIFKDIKSFKKSLHFFYPNIFSMWSKKTRDIDFNNTFKMGILLIVIFIISGLNGFVYKLLI